MYEEEDDVAKFTRNCRLIWTGPIIREEEQDTLRWEEDDIGVDQD